MPRQQVGSRALGAKFYQDATLMSAISFYRERWHGQGRARSFIDAAAARALFFLVAIFLFRA